MKTLNEKATAFKALHDNGSLFVMPCAWDAFSAMTFEQAGFQCIGTTSGGVNWVNGRRDYVYSTPASEMLAAYGVIASASRIPTSGDLENGYGTTTEAVGSTIKLAVKEGLVGGSIEDIETVPTDEQFNNGILFGMKDAVARIKAAKTAADETGIAFTLTARCEVYYTGSKTPFEIAVERCQAYADAGADCVFVPGLNDLQQLSELVKAVAVPVSFGMGATETPLTLEMLEDVGVTRVSTGGGITRAILAETQSIATRMMSTGDFSYLENALSEAEVTQVLTNGKAS